MTLIDMCIQATITKGRIHTRAYCIITMNIDDEAKLQVQQYEQQS